MFEGLSKFNEVLLVYGRLRLGALGVLGAFSSIVVFGGLSFGLIVGWIWNSFSGTPILPGHEILGGDLDISVLLVAPIIWIAFQVLKGRTTMTPQAAEDRQEHWQTEHWILWNSEGQYSISITSFLMSVFGIVTLLCLVAGLMNAVVSLAM